jgi:hypothetical protein
MTTPVPDADAAEQRRPLTDDEPGPGPAVRDDAPEADALEQSLPAGTATGLQQPDVPLEADAADAAEQAAVVPLDDDEDAARG